MNCFVQNNGLDELLYDTYWYTAPTRLQMDLSRLMRRMQNGVKLTVGPLDTVNRESFAIVSNAALLYCFDWHVIAILH